MSTYAQISKINARHKMLFYAVETLTTNRNGSCCVERSYIRKVIDHFMTLDESKEKNEAQKIKMDYVKSWEKLHDSCLGNKRPEDLVVCYLSGPEPQNDFDELVSLGILPSNIWAFENDQNSYDTAVSSFSKDFPQPKIVKQSIEQFFIHTPKKFDIVYIDACGAIASEQQCLRIIATLCKYHRLNSPGIIVTNFACPDFSKADALEEYSDLIARYLFFKDYPNESLNIENDVIESSLYDSLKMRIKQEIGLYYGELITTSIIDIASLAVPIQRFVNSNYIKSIIDKPTSSFKEEIREERINKIHNSSLYKFFYLSKILEKNNGNEHKRTKSFIKGFTGLESPQVDLFEALSVVYKLKEKDEKVLKKQIREIKQYFENGTGMYQFLDKPNSSLMIDVIINQFAYPLHYNSNAIRRYKYQAKQMEMYMDVIVLDECRYIYEWLPSMHQLIQAFSDVSWQYIFRFALDGLIKQRLNYNNEFFFGGSVISKEISGFNCKLIQDREHID